MKQQRFIRTWPRLMKISDASAYIGTSTTNFQRLVEKGQLVQPLIRGGERLWDIHDLDEHAENLKRKDEVVANDWTGQTI